MNIDPELLEDFITEMEEIERLLKNAIEKIIRTKMQDGQYFEEFGQIIDRVYGTATTLGYVDIGNYTKAMKDVSYMAGQSDNFRGKEKTCRLMFDCINIFGDLRVGIKDQEQLDKIKIKMNQYIGKVDILNRKEFFSIQKKSCG